MTGLDHFRDAERAFENAKDCDLGSRQERFLLDSAQIHATLALAADPIGRIARTLNVVNELEHGRHIDTDIADRLREALGETDGAR